MRFSTTFIFLLLFAVVVVFYERIVPQFSHVDEPSAKPAPATADLLKLGEKDEVIWLQIQDLEKKQMFTFTRESGHWMLKQPVVYAADDETIDVIVRKLVAANSVRHYRVEHNWAEYGLASPKMKIGIRTADVPGKKTLSLGDPSPVGNFIYARWEGGSEYFLIDKKIKDAFEKTLYSLLDKRIFRISIEDLSRVMIQIDSQIYKLVRQGDHWQWEKPEYLKNEALKAKEMQGFFLQLQNLFIKDLLLGEPFDEDKKKYFPAGNFIKVWGAKNHIETFYLGDEVPMRDAFYGCREGEKVIFLVDRNTVRIFIETVTMLASASTL